jgi:hypothetical protein
MPLSPPATDDGRARTSTVSSGTATLAPTVTATLSSASIGIAGVLRVREASSDINVSAQSVFPPRNLVSATGLTGDDIVTITLLPAGGTDLTAVRAAASGIDVTGQASFLRVDAEQPFGISLTTRPSSPTSTAPSGRSPRSPSRRRSLSDVISDAIRGVGAAVKIESPLAGSGTATPASSTSTGGSSSSANPAHPAPARITVRTETDSDGDTLNELLDEATEGTILVRKQTSLSRLDGTYACSTTPSPQLVRHLPLVRAQRRQGRRLARRDGSRRIHASRTSRTTSRP